jgi:iron complex transport system ATP-binding protein
LNRRSGQNKAEESLSQVLLEARGLSFSYHNKVILEDLSLQLYPGDFVAVLGPNGVGKSTLIKLLSGGLLPTKGQVIFGTKDLQAMTRREVAAQIAVMPQEGAVAFSFTALEVVLFGRFPHQGGLAFASEADLNLAKEALQLVGALHLAARQISSLSGGEKQRVILAKTLAQDPTIFLLDEPTAHLDLAHQALALQAAAARTKKGAVLAVLHDCNLAALYANRVILLHQGKILACGSVQEMFTASLLSQCFGHPVEIVAHPIYQSPAVLPRR